VLAQLGLTPAQRAQALDCFAVYQEQRSAAAPAKQLLLSELQRLAGGGGGARGDGGSAFGPHSGANPATGYPGLPARLERALAQEHAALAALSATLQCVMTKAQVARWCVYSYPFFASSVDLLACLEQDCVQPGGTAQQGAAGAAGVNRGASSSFSLGAVYIH